MRVRPSAWRRRAIMHSTCFSESAKVQEPLALSSTITSHSLMSNVTGMVNVVAQRAVLVCTELVSLLFILITYVYLLRCFGQELLLEGGDRTLASLRLDLLVRSSCLSLSIRSFLKTFPGGPQLEEFKPLSRSFDVVSCDAFTCVIRSPTDRKSNR